MTVACFWDSELSGIAISTGSHTLELRTGLTTEQMFDKEVFLTAGWNFDHTWTMRDGEYPMLQWEDAIGLEN